MLSEISLSQVGRPLVFSIKSGAPPRMGKHTGGGMIARRCVLTGATPFGIPDVILSKYSGEDSGIAKFRDILSRASNFYFLCGSGAEMLYFLSGARDRGCRG